MEEYNIPLLNEKVIQYNRISVIAIFINLLVFLFFSIYFENQRVSISCGISSVVVAACLLVNAYQQKIKTTRHFGFISIYALIAAGWCAAGFYWLGIIAFVFAILSRIATRKLAVYFSEELVIYPSFPKRKIKWNDLSNVILKDDLLTIDHTTNKLIQQRIDSGINAIDENKFNQFCRQQLRKIRPHTTDPDGWDAIDLLGRFTESMNIK